MIDATRPPHVNVREGVCKAPCDDPERRKLYARVFFITFSFSPHVGVSLGVSPTACDSRARPFLRRRRRDVFGGDGRLAVPLALPADRS